MGNTIFSKIILYTYPCLPMAYRKTAVFNVNTETFLMLLARKGHFDETWMLFELLAKADDLLFSTENQNRFIHVSREEIRPNNIVLHDPEEKDDIIIDIVPHSISETDKWQRQIKEVIDTQNRNRVKKLLKKRIQKDLNGLYNKNIKLEMSYRYNYTYYSLLPNNFDHYKALTIRDKDNEVIGMAEYKYKEPKIVFFVDMNKIEGKKSLQEEDIKNILFNKIG